MPRKNKNKPHEYYIVAHTDSNKRRFATRRQAEEAANEQMLLKPDLQLYVYKGLDGGWYLTRKESGQS